MALCGSLAPATRRTSPSDIGAFLRISAARRGSFRSVFQSGSIISSPPRMTHVVHPLPPAARAALRCAMPSVSLSPAPATTAPTDSLLIEYCFTSMSTNLMPRRFTRNTP